jgi:hypothetical protein
MTRKLLKTVAVVVIALAPLIAAGSAEAHGGGFHGGGFHGGGFGRGGFGPCYLTVYGTTYCY